MPITYDMAMRSGKGVQAIGMLAMVAMLAFAPGIASAKHEKNHADEPPRAQGISKDQAIDIAQRRYKARVVRAEAAENDGRRVYVLRMLSDEGRVWTVRIDAQTGSEF
jgi:uncharacterized membrane protein YkoI